MYVVDDDAAVRDSLQLLLHSVGLDSQSYATAAEFLDGFDPARPGCLLLDIRLPGMSGLELQERLSSLHMDLPIIFVTAHGDVPMAVEALKAGAVDFIQKPFRDQVLVDKIQRALAANLRRRAEKAAYDRIAARIDSLTPRERQVMDMIVAGKANKVIASELQISQRTVEIHRARVMRKMEAQSLSHLVKMAIQTKRPS